MANKEPQQIDLFHRRVLKAKPFLKWAGGKGQLLPEIEKRLPKKIKNTRKVDNYVEPFVGGGAVFFYLNNNYTIKKATLIDNNKELIIGYKVIQNNPQELIEQLRSIERQYLKKSSTERERFYYEQRDKYNKQMRDFDYQHYSEEWIKRAVYLIFLNRTCYNGLFRQNSKGEFNVPMGRYKNPTICDAKNILEVHESLKKATIICGDFSEAEQYITQDSFVYFDPPYRPLSNTANFTDYSNAGFTDEEQKRLAAFYKKMDKRGAFLMLSNSDPKNEDPNDDFFDKLYAEFNIQRVKAKRAISCKGTGRGEITELLITNY